MSNVFQTCLKGFKLKMMVLEPKSAQLVESYKELVDLFNSTSRMVQKPSLSSKTFVQLVKVEPQPVEVRLRGSQGQRWCQALNVNS